MLKCGTAIWHRAIALAAQAMYAQNELAICVQHNMCPMRPEGLHAFAAFFTDWIHGAEAQQLGIAALLQDPTYAAWETVITVCRMHAGELTLEHMQAAERFCSLVIAHICQIA